MLRSRTTELRLRVQRGTTIWSVAAGMHGAALSVYCSIPAKPYFDGSLNNRHAEPESQGILDNRQLQM
jgi:hypothetical protein